MGKILSFFYFFDPDLSQKAGEREIRNILNEKMTNYAVYCVNYLCVHLIMDSDDIKGCS